MNLSIVLFNETEIESTNDASDTDNTDNTDNTNDDPTVCPQYPNSFKLLQRQSSMFIKICK